MEKISAVQEETNILQESIEEENDEIVSSFDEKDAEESKEQNKEERISYRVTLQLIHCLISLRAYRRMIAMMTIMIPLILLKYPF